MLIFFNILFGKGNFDPRTILMSSLVFIFFTPLKIYYNNISLSLTLPFSTRTPPLPLPPQNPLDYVNWIMLALKYVIWRPRTPWSLSHFSLDVNRSGPEANSTANHRFYRAMGRLHGPWCQRPLVGRKWSSTQPQPSCCSQGNAVLHLCGCVFLQGPRAGFNTLFVCVSIGKKAMKHPDPTSLVKILCTFKTQNQTFQQLCFNNWFYLTKKPNHGG